MSRIGKLPIPVPPGINVNVSSQIITVKGPKGELHHTIPSAFEAKIADGIITILNPKSEKKSNALHGTTRALINNMVVGVQKGFEKTVEVRGVGFRFTVSGKKITFALGFSHPVEFNIPTGITITTDEENKSILIIRGCDKQLVGQTAARIRSLRKPEQYKGKGIRYLGEHITLKQGKKAAK